MRFSIVLVEAGAVESGAVESGGGEVGGDEAGGDEHPMGKAIHAARAIRAIKKKSDEKWRTEYSIIEYTA